MSLGLKRKTWTGVPTGSGKGAPSSFALTIPMYFLFTPSR